MVLCELRILWNLRTFEIQLPREVGILTKEPELGKKVLKKGEDLGRRLHGLVDVICGRIEILEVPNASWRGHQFTAP